MNPLEHIDFDQLAKEFYRKISEKKGGYYPPKYRIEKLVQAPGFVGRPDAEREFLELLNDSNKIKQIIIGQPLELQKRVNEFDAYSAVLYIENKMTAFGREILNAFNYDGFRQSKRARWLSNELNIKACLYCNGQYTLNSKDKIFYTFDHYFPKDQYPYLSLSFYNLIPVCDNCNRLKSNQTDEFHHPYTEGPLTDHFSFVIDPKSEVAFRVNKYRNEQLLEICLTTDGHVKFDTHKRILRLEERYKAHKDIAAELVWKSIIYTDTYRSELSKLMDQTGINEGELTRLILSNYPAPEDFHKRPLSKFVSDLANKLGLLK